MTEKEILNIIHQDEWMMSILNTVKSLDLPDWMIGAGFVRPKILDYLHGYSERTLLSDVDVIYFNKEDLSEDREKEAEALLSKRMPSVHWSVTNQARMYTINNDEPYISSEDALSHWPETCTCIAVKIDEYGTLILIAPYGIKDFADLRVRPCPKFIANHDIKEYKERVMGKRWTVCWPKLSIEY